MKKVIALLLSLVLALCATGFTALAEEPLTIGFCNYTDTDQFFITVKESMNRVCEERGYKLLYAVSEADPAKMRTAWESFVTQGADIIVDFSLLEDSGSTMAKNFKEQYGISVICVDNVYDNAFFFGVNNVEAGKTAGYYVAEKVQEKWDGQVDCMLQFYREANGPTVKLRNSGIYDGMVESGIELAEENVYWVDSSGTNAAAVDPAIMKSLVTDFLTAHPDEHHIVIGCFNDDGGNAAYNAAKASGREEDVMIISHNADPVALDTMAAGESCWIGTVCYSPATYGDQIIDLAERLLAGEDVPTENYANTFVINPDNVAEFIG